MPPTTCLTLHNDNVEKGHNSHKIKPILFQMFQITYSSAPISSPSLEALAKISRYLADKKSMIDEQMINNSKKICLSNFFQVGGTIKGTNYVKNEWNITSVIVDNLP